MPLTFLHYPIAYALYKFNGKLNLPGVIVGSMFADLEIPFIVLLGGMPYNRLVLHSILGACTLGTGFSALCTVLLYPYLVISLRPTSLQSTIKAKCSLSPTLIVSCLLGALSHVLLDVLTHRDSPLFWPFQSFTRNPVYSVIGWRNVPIFTLIFHVILAIILIGIVSYHRRNFTYLLIGKVE